MSQSPFGFFILSDVILTRKSEPCTGMSQSPFGFFILSDVAIRKQVFEGTLKVTIAFRLLHPFGLAKMLAESDIIPDTSQSPFGFFILSDGGWQS